MQKNNQYLTWIVLLLALICYGMISYFLDKLPRKNDQDLLSISVPPKLQIILAGGDRYLAANLATYRAVVVGNGQLDPKTYEILGNIQKDAALLNPAHEDNYYLSQAMLPWNNQVEADISIQRAASQAREWDTLPAFFYAFDQYYFLRDPVAGAKTLKWAAERAPASDRDSLTNLAARWSEKGDDPREAIKLVTVMMEGTRDKELKKNLQSRITRLTGLTTLRDAAKQFQQNNGRPLASLDELIKQSLIAELPQDPLGDGYAIDKNGLPVIAKAVPKPAPKQP
jgi:hypothetical protein